jgi:hypothetical protein
MTTVRIAHAEPRPGRLGNDRVVIQGFLVVLADDAGQRALPLWLRGEPGADSLRELIERPPGDTTVAEAPEDLVTRLLRAAGARVNGVDIDEGDGSANIDASARLLLPEATSTRVGISGRSGILYAPSRLGLALTLALASDAPVQVADPLMERFAVPVEDGDLLAPFLDVLPPPDPGLKGRPPPFFVLAGRRPRFEPRNMGFADGLDRWELDRGSLGEAGEQAGPPAHMADYTSAAGDGCAILSSAVPEPWGSAALVQMVFADDYRNAAVAFSADVRASADAEQAALRLQVLRRGWVVRPAGIETRAVNVPGGHGWARYEITAEVPGEADLIRFGVTLTGPGRIELRNPNLGAGQTPAPSGP